MREANDDDLDYDEWRQEFVTPPRRVCLLGSFLMAVVIFATLSNIELPDPYEPPPGSYCVERPILFGLAAERSCAAVATGRLFDNPELFNSPVEEPPPHTVSSNARLLISSVVFAATYLLLGLRDGAVKSLVVMPSLLLLFSACWIVLDDLYPGFLGGWLFLCFFAIGAPIGFRFAYSARRESILEASWNEIFNLPTPTRPHFVGLRHMVISERMLAKSYSSFPRQDIDQPSHRPAGGPAQSRSDRG